MTYKRRKSFFHSFIEEATRRGVWALSLFETKDKVSILTTVAYVTYVLNSRCRIDFNAHESRRLSSSNEFRVQVCLGVGHRSGHVWRIAFPE